MMHVIFRDGLEDRDWLEKLQRSATPSCASGRASGRPRARPRRPGLGVAEIEGFAREYATTRPSAIRVNYGLNRHAGGGMAVRTIACLPAVVGAWRDAGGGVLLSSSGTFPVDEPALQRPDLIRPGTRTLNMSQLGRILNDPTLDPPVKALFVYNCNPAAVAPDQEAVRRGLAREDLFTVVHEQFQTDTADFADLLLPATTTLEHYDIHKAYGHLYISLSKPAIAPVGESLVEHRAVPPARRAHGPRPSRACARSDEQMARQAFDWDHPRMAGIDFERLERETSVRLQRARPVPRRSPRAASRRRRASASSSRTSSRPRGSTRSPGYTPPREGPTSSPELAKRYPLAFISPPAHHFLNSTFSAQPVFVRREGEPSLTIHPDDARAPRHRRRPDGPHLQRPRLVPGEGARLGRRAPGRRRRACRSGGPRCARAAATPTPSPARS